MNRPAAVRRTYYTNHSYTLLRREPGAKCRYFFQTVFFNGRAPYRSIISMSYGKFINGSEDEWRQIP